MVEEKKLKNWTQSYWNQVSRNIGIINIEDQEILRKANIAIFGLGGLGGPLAEQLVRSGCENLLICDNDQFEPSNLNRQICTRNDLGKYKVDIMERFLKSINPELNLNKVINVNKKNIKEKLSNISIVALTLDDPIGSILIARECSKNKIPMIESWAIPYLCAWWFTSDSIDYETCYGLNTHNLEIQDIEKSDEAIKNIKNAFFLKLIKFPEIKKRYDREKNSINQLLSQEIPSISLAPIVRLNASYLAYEIIFSGILKIKQMVKAPKVVGYDYLKMKSFEFNFN
ncbi:MAG: ThiF family adenylyltransferase [Promethearchaeota archaeon]